MLQYIHGSRKESGKISMSILSVLNENNMWENVKARKPFVFKSAGLPTVTWDSILAIIDADMKMGKKFGQGDNGIYNEFGFKVTRADRVDVIYDQIQELKPFFNVSPDFLVDPRSSHQFYVSLTTSEKSYGIPHDDPENVFFWQLGGKANWKIWSEDRETVELDVILEPGDFIYCPPLRQHHIIAITPRFGVSIGFGELIE